VIFNFLIWRRSVPTTGATSNRAIWAEQNGGCLHSPSNRVNKMALEDGKELAKMCEFTD
jgi:hypothetical protein